MGSVIKQINAVIVMSLNSLPQRLWMSLATLLAVAIVVAVLLAFLAMGNGFKKTLESTGAEDIVIMMREGASAELNSVLMRDQANLIEEAPGVLNDEQGAIVSGETYVIVDGKKRSSGTDANIPLRGVSSRAVDIRDNFSIVSGRMFEPGKNEIVVGSSILSEFAGFELGSEVKLGNAKWKVVGIFDTGGSVFSSELWTDIRVVQSQFNRGSSVQIVRAKLESPEAIEQVKAYIAADARLNLDVQSEKTYYGEQAKNVGGVINYIGWPLSIAMALGALAGALNTMYTSVAQRSVEIATLRAIGFGSLSSFLGTLFESVVLSILGGRRITNTAFLFFDGMTTSTLGSSFTQIVFSFEISSDALVDGVSLALIIGLVGGFFPALRAARLPVILAFSSQG